jgi:pyruvate, water dikinase
MVRSDEGSAGVMFTIDSDTGFPDTIVVNVAWGLGENVVGGEVTPDQYTVYKPFLDDRSLRPIIGKAVGAKEKKLRYASGGDGGETTENVETTEDERAAFVLDDDEILDLARWGMIIERHYDRPMDIEWARDGRTGELFVVQARPETVQSQTGAGTLSSFHLTETGETLVTGLAIGQAVAAGPVQKIASADDVDQFRDGCVLVTEMTDPDWVPIMRRAAAIVTDRGGRTSHAAIVSRELGVPALVGTGNATDLLDEGREVTVSCVEGDEGYVYDGILAYEERELDLDAVPETTTRVMMNIGSPAAAMQWWRLPAHGIGLARMEYLVNNVIQAHPLALLHLDDVEDDDARQQIEELTAGWPDKAEYFVDHLARGIATIAASQYPEPVVVRLSDFKTNEYAGLLGGTQFEPEEENPMLGWRGASRYDSEEYREAFALECRALRRVRREMGFTNVIVMVPFCRTPEEADRVLATMAEQGLERGEDDLKVYVMAEIPANILQADEFAERFDGFSIGSNDLTQLTLGIGRDDDRLTHLFDERNPSVKRLIHELIETAHAAGKPVGICGQAPSDHPDFAEFLVEQRIDSISLNPDSVLDVISRVAEAEGRRDGSG